MPKIVFWHYEYSYFSLLFLQIFRHFELMDKSKAISRNEEQEHKLQQEVRIPILDIFQGWSSKQGHFQCLGLLNKTLMFDLTCVFVHVVILLPRGSFLCLWKMQTCPASGEFLSSLFFLTPLQKVDYKGCLSLPEKTVLSDRLYRSELREQEQRPGNRMKGETVICQEASRRYLTSENKGFTWMQTACSTQYSKGEWTQMPQRAWVWTHRGPIWWIQIEENNIPSDLAGYLYFHWEMWSLNPPATFVMSGNIFVGSRN